MAKAKPAREKKDRGPVDLTGLDPSKSTAVIGDGWAAMGLAGLLGASGHDVLWITGTGARTLSPLPFVDATIGMDGWLGLLSKLDIPSDEPRSGHFLREFRHKSFSRPAWHKSPTREDRKQVRDEYLWAPESRFVPEFEARFDLSIGELEEKIREKIAALPNVKRLSGLPVSGFEFSDDAPAVILGSGEKLPCSRVFFADRWSSLIGMEGLPKGHPLNRGRAPMGVLQAIFTHSSAIASSEMKEAFYGATHKDAGEEFTRSVWGYFFDEGRKSCWTIFLAEDESEDNHAIAKKLRRLKQSLDRMFTGTEWLPEGTKELMDTVADEQVRFEESFVFSGTEPLAEPARLPGLERIAFLTDGFGPSVALAQVVSAVGAETGVETRAEAQNPAVDPVASAQAESADGGPESASGSKQVVDE